MKRFSPFICGILLLVAGCCPTAKEPDYRPTLPVHAVVDRINANNQLIPSLWTTVDLKDLSFFDDKGHHHSVSGDGSLLYRRGGDLYFTGKHVLGTPLFEMGSNSDDYWLTIPEMKTAWWGHHRNVGKPCVKALPIRPDLVVEVLGISTFNSNLLERPVPVMRFNHDESAYMFVWHDRLPDRWVATKEIWYDRDTLSPIKVLLFDLNGRTILKATLSEPQPIEVPELPKEKWPKIPTVYRLEFPESKASFKLKLDSVALTHRGKKNIVLPSDGTFATPDDWDQGIKVIQVDKDCRD